MTATFNRGQRGCISEGYQVCVMSRIENRSSRKPSPKSSSNAQLKNPKPRCSDPPTFTTRHRTSEPRFRPLFVSLSQSLNHPTSFRATPWVLTS